MLVYQRVISYSPIVSVPSRIYWLPDRFGPSALRLFEGLIQAIERWS